MTATSPRVLTLQGQDTQATVSAIGATVQTATDLLSGRELLYQRQPTGTEGFLAASTGGWVEMFPNDSIWGRYPDHGVVWDAAFSVLVAADDECVLETVLTRPNVRVRRTISLLTGDRRGVRSEYEVAALKDTGPFLWTAHPMLAVNPGWAARLPASSSVVDRQLPGRYSGAPTVADVLATWEVPQPHAGWSEVLYVDGCAQADLVSRDGRHGTRLTWDSTFLRCLWLTTVTGEAGIDLSCLLEPSTSRPYDLADAIAAGQALAMAAGARRTWWAELESLDDPCH